MMTQTESLRTKSPRPNAFLYESEKKCTSTVSGVAEHEILGRMQKVAIKGERIFNACVKSS